MVPEKSTFIGRARVFVAELKKGNFPNASSLAEECKCSSNTAQRTIYRLRDEYLVPIEYDSSNRGYYLKDESFSLPELLPPGKDELAALLLSCTLLKSLEFDELHSKLQTLWSQFVSSNSSVSRDLTPLTNVFSSDDTEVCSAADLGVLRYVQFAASGQDLRVTYDSPWSEKSEREFLGRIERVHLSDGTLYILFHDQRNLRLVLNSSFINEVEELDYRVEIDTSKNKEPVGAENWLKLFGVFSGDDVEDIEIVIEPPASLYYKTKRWHESQEDTFDGDVLTRRMKAVISPELTRRVLGLGAAVRSIKPESLREEVVNHAKKVLENHLQG